jgi:uncharacterized membrane protein YdjX (TVP38/TMEM64 family)
MDQNQEPAKQSKWPLIISIIVIASLVGAYFFINPVNAFLKNAFEVLTSDDKQRISNWVSQLGFWGPFFIIVTMIAQMFLLVIPSPLLMVVSVLAYGQFWGAVLSIVAIFAASSIGYMIGRYLGVVTVDRLIGHKKEQKLEFYVERYGFWAVIITRLAPMLSNDAISLVGGILRMGYWKFIGATLIGIIPLASLIAFFGENNDRLKTGLIWTSVVSLVLLGLYVYYDRKKNPVNKQEQQPAQHH